jgi:hypothetical protein
MGTRVEIVAARLPAIAVVQRQALTAAAVHAVAAAVRAPAVAVRTEAAAPAAVVARMADIAKLISLEVASHTQSGGSRKGAFRFSQFVLLF